MYSARALILLTAVYLALTANLQISNIVTGLLIATLILWILRPTERKIDWQRLPDSLWAIIKYIVVLIYDLIVSGIQMTRIVLNPTLSIKQGNITIPTECESEMAKALSAHAITITPGELVVETDEEGALYTHVLDATKAQEGVKRAQEMREQMLNKIFS